MTWQKGRGFGCVADVHVPHVERCQFARSAIVRATFVLVSGTAALVCLWLLAAGHASAEAAPAPVDPLPSLVSPGALPPLPPLPTLPVITPPAPLLTPPSPSPALPSLPAS